jgi:hypothetical protein
VGKIACRSVAEWKRPLHDFAHACKQPAWAESYLTAIGATVEPVPPWIFKGWMMKANS